MQHIVIVRCWEGLQRHIPHPMKHPNVAFALFNLEINFLFPLILFLFPQYFSKATLEQCCVFVKNALHINCIESWMMFQRRRCTDINWRDNYSLLLRWICAIRSSFFTWIYLTAYTTNRLKSQKTQDWDRTNKQSHIKIKHLLNKALAQIEAL